MIEQSQQRKLYRLFVERRIDDETQTFYCNKKFPAVMGSNDFREAIHSRLSVNAEIPEIKELKPAPSFSFIIHAVSIAFATSEEIIFQSFRGRGKKNIARSAAIYCCRKMGGLPLNEIAKQFGLSRYGSVSGAVAKFDRQIKGNSYLAGLIHEAENIISK